MPSPYALSNASPTVALRDSVGTVANITVDSFGRLRTSGPRSLLNVKQVDLAPSPVLIANALGVGSTAVYSRPRSSTALKATVDGELAVRQTARRPAYEAGKSQEVLATARMAPGTPSSGAETAFMRMGQFDADMGVYWEVSSANGVWTNYIVLRSDTIGTQRISQHASELNRWNIDTFDGKLRPTNPSGFVLDPTNCNIVAISYEWLGVGGVLVSFVIDNMIVPAHFFANANNQSAVYMRTPNLPVRWECELSGAALPEAELEAICASVISEGGAEELGMLRSDYLTTALNSTSGVTRELLSMRLRCNGTTDGLEAITSATVFPEAVGAVNTTNDEGLLIVGYNPTFADAGTWGDPVGTDGNLSHVQICKTGRVVTNPGHVFFAQQFSDRSRESKGSFDKTIALGCRPKIASGYGVADVISLMLVNTSGSSTDTLPDLTWREIG